MSILNDNFISAEDAAKILEGCGYTVTKKDDSSEVVSENAKKGYKGIKAGTKKAKKKEEELEAVNGEEENGEEEEAVDESAETEEPAILEFIEFQGETYGLTEDIFQDEDGAMFVKLQPKKEDA
jgi:hypothetical protein